VDKSGNTSFWAAATATTTSTADLFQPIMDEVDALQDQVDGLVFDNFPEFAGSPSDNAGNDTVYAGVFSQITNRQDTDNVLQQTLDLIGAVQSDKRAFILDADTVKVSDTETLAQRIDSAQADFGPVNARIDTEASARASADSALATSISSVSATAGANTASISTLSSAQATTAGKVNAAYTMVLNSNGYVVGWKFQNDGTTGDMTIAADKFSIVSPTGSG
jgi:hypothetical protein